jgi:carbon-monoxide dehydrogenase large subunit
MAEQNGKRERIFGAAMKRSEDPRLLRGEGQYIADLKMHGMVHAAVLRSPYAHALIKGIDASACRADPRTVDVLLPEDVANFGDLVCIDAEETTLPFDQPVIARGKVRYVGEPVAVVVAADRHVAEDLLQLIEVDYEPLEAVVDSEAAMAEGAPLVHETSNVVDTLHLEVGDADAAIEAAPHVVRGRFKTQRYAGVPMETRGCIAEWDERWSSLTLWSSTQVPNAVKGDLIRILGLSENTARVIVPDVGGAFGSKIQTYPEEVLVAELARRTGRPVKWIEDRWEHAVATTHGREQFHDVEVGFDDEGKILGLRDRCVTNTGAYLQRLTLVEPFIGIAMMPGPYEIPALKGEAPVVVTNKTPMNPFRGVGHVQAAFTMERVMDLIAEELELDPAEVRLRNMIGPEQMPLPRGMSNVLAGEIVYDSGDFPQCLKRALELAEYEKTRDEFAAARAEGRCLGIGIGFFVEETGLGPFESATVRVEPSGQVVVLTGACTSGQGHHTVLAQIAADELGVPFDAVKVIHGDTALIRNGVGTYASRTAAVGGTAVRIAAGAVKRKILRVAEQVLEAAEGDLELRDGAVQVKGSPSLALPITDVAQAVAPGKPLPEGIESYGLEETDIFHPKSNTFSYGAHVATVEVDPETGVVELLRHVVCNDSGTVINPLLLDGQVQGGIALGVGGALLEDLVYDEEGQPRNPTFMEYLLPTVGTMPEVVVDHMAVPTPHNPDGMKGGGEGGAVGAPAAIANAVSNALGGAPVTETPLTPQRVFELVKGREGAGA